MIKTLKCIHSLKSEWRGKQLRSFIKIYGPPLVKAVKALEKVAIETPKVCIMNTIISQSAPTIGDVQFAQNYFRSVSSITKERCNNIISKSGESLGEYDFFFEWFREPSTKELNELLEKIDETLAPLGCKYTITTKK